MDPAQLQVLKFKQCIYKNVEDVWL